MSSICYVERAISYMVSYAYNLGSAMMLWAMLWHKQHRLEEARPEVMCAVELFEKLGATQDVEGCRTLLQQIQRELNNSVASDQLREFPQTMRVPAHVDFQLQAQGT